MVVEPAFDGIEAQTFTAEFHDFSDNFDFLWVQNDLTVGDIVAVGNGTSECSIWLFGIGGCGFICSSEWHIISDEQVSDRTYCESGSFGDLV